MGGTSWRRSSPLLGTGRTRRVRGDNLVPIEFEIAIELPDKYVRKDEVPAEESEPTSTGFAGDRSFSTRRRRQFPGRAGGPGPAGAPAGRPGAAPPAAVRLLLPRRLLRVRRHLLLAQRHLLRCTARCRCRRLPRVLRLRQVLHRRQAHPRAERRRAGRDAVGADAGDAGRAAQDAAEHREAGFRAARARACSRRRRSYPLTYSFAARAEAPQGTADVLDVKGDGQLRDAALHPRRLRSCR